MKRQIDGLLARGITRARLGILWERVWPPLAAFATVFGLFLVVSWLGLWLWLPPLGRAIGVVLFGLLALAALVAACHRPDAECRRTACAGSTSAAVCSIVRRSR